MTRNLVMLCAVTMGTTGCAYFERHYPEYFQRQSASTTLPQTWARADGQAVDAAQLEVDNSVCRGEMDQANMALGNDARIHPEIFGYSDAMISDYSGCMARNGYTAAR